VLSRTAKIAIAAVAATIAVAFGIERLIVTEEESLEPFVEALTGKIDGERIDRALLWTDADRVPLELSLRGQTWRFEQGAELSREAHSKLALYQGERLSLLSNRIEVKGKAANVTVDTFSRRGRVAVDYELRKTGDRWLVSGVHVR